MINFLVIFLKWTRNTKILKYNDLRFEGIYKIGKEALDDVQLGKFAVVYISINTSMNDFKEIK